jgi:MoaA/NifB/PqqE/SkfB family radical SAM enzyme
MTIREAGYSVEDVVAFLHMLNRPVHLNLTGGEPLLHPRLMETIHAFKRIDPQNQIGIFTSGVVLQGSSPSSISTELARELAKAGLSCAYLSVYHYEDIYHDLITNTPGSLRCVLESIKNLIIAGISVSIHLVLNKYNVSCLEQVIQRLDAMDVSEIRLLRLVKIGNAAIHWNSVGVSYQEQNLAIHDIFHKRQRFGCTLSFSGFPKMIGCRPLLNSTKCQAGTGVFYITFDGDIFPCACTRGHADHKIAHISDKATIEEFLSADYPEFHEECLNPE